MEAGGLLPVHCLGSQDSLSLQKRLLLLDTWWKERAYVWCESGLDVRTLD